jgi:hypothetical protein
MSSSYLAYVRAIERDDARESRYPSRAELRRKSELACKADPDCNRKMVEAAGRVAAKRETERREFEAVTKGMTVQQLRQYELDRNYLEFAQDTHQ